MREPAVIRMLPDGRRLHLHDGPIDLIIEASGTPEAISTAYKAAARRFVSILDELCSRVAAAPHPCAEKFRTPSRRGRSTHVCRCRTLLRTVLHHAHGRRRRCRGRNNSRLHAWRCPARSRLRERWRGHCNTSQREPVLQDRNGRAAGSAPPSLALSKFQRQIPFAGSPPAAGAAAAFPLASQTP